MTEEWSNAPSSCAVRRTRRRVRTRRTHAAAFRANDATVRRTTTRRTPRRDVVQRITAARARGWLVGWLVGWFLPLRSLRSGSRRCSSPPSRARATRSTSAASPARRATGCAWSTPRCVLPFRSVLRLLPVAVAPSSSLSSRCDARQPWMNPGGRATGCASSSSSRRQGQGASSGVSLSPPPRHHRRRARHRTAAAAAPGEVCSSNGASRR